MQTFKKGCVNFRYFFRGGGVQIFKKILIWGSKLGV